MTSVATNTEAAPKSRWRLDRTPNFVGAIVGVYVIARLISAIMLIVTGHHQVDVVWFENETGYLRMTVLWDAFWYRQIVEDGYPSVLPRDPWTGKLWQNAWAFYPMFPMLTRGIMAITGGSFALVGSTLSLVVGGAAAVVIGLFLRSKVGTRVALAAVTVWATCITSVTLQVAYTESLGVIVIASALWALDKRKWAWAGCIAVLSGFTRAVTLPLGLVALICVVVRWTERNQDGKAISRREYAAMLWSLVGCGLSGLVWPLVVWQGTGEFDGYTQTMTAWRAYDKILPFVPWWDFFNRTIDFVPLAALGLVLMWAAVFAIGLGPWARGLGVTLRSWCFAYPLYLWAVMDPTTSIFRYAILMFPWMVIMIGGGWGKPGEDPLENHTDTVTWWKWTFKRPRLTVRWLLVLTAVWVVIGLLSQSWWIWEIWQFTPPADNPP
ncbi:hypothetical protein [Dermatophilus congolensis]|uniref:hypothetical protein n=1 Tax=Dermatophilus congolensis TaxID=1863 RepID=UPI001AAED74C|nr:hypothetical protein [Dermatophilus congolensis]MBO3152093.1 hypothetical protein [Dermatophilus congolensis]MBO3160894.1 hypothetical protein [Dermatophilus congolensis]MBO3163381.1 hypothetical protein [Dermatophilus congolensis]MBO3176931.1 hypothetical protein [Dermatophilus congolensis]